MISPTGEELIYALRFDFKASNNEVGYEALMLGMKLVWQVGVISLKIHGDSQLIVNQVKGNYEAKEDLIKKYPARVWKMVMMFEKVEMEQILRS